MQFRKSGLSLAALLLIGATPALAQEKDTKKAPPAPPAVQGAEVLSLPGEARGDAPSQLADLLKAISERPDDPGSIMAVDALGGLWDFVPDGRKKCREVLESVAGASPKAKNGFALESYRANLQELRLADGDRAGAEELAKARGYLRHWLVVGAFGHSQRAVLDEVFAPEIDARQKTVDLKQKYLTNKADVSVTWTKVPARTFTQTVSFGHVLRSVGGANYLMAHVESQRDEDVTFAYEGTSAKLFVNRALAGTVDRHRKRLDSRVRIDAHLKKGWNRIVLKTGEYATFFSLRVTTRDGMTISDLKPETDLAVHDVDQDADSDKDVRESNVCETLAKATTPELRALYAFALFQTSRSEEAYTILQSLGAYPEKSDKNEKSAPSSPLVKSAWFWVMSAEIAEQADHLPDQAHRVKAREGYKKALQIDPAYSVALKRLAEYELDDAKAKEGLSGLEDEIEKNPADDATRVSLFHALMRQRWEHEAEKVLADLETRGKELPGVIATRIQWVQSKGNRQQLQELFEKQLKYDHRALWVLERRRQLALASGDEKVARASLAEEEAASYDSEEGDWDIHRADLARTLGKPDEEIAALEKAKDARPLDLDIRERLARTYVERASEGDDKKALALLDDILENEPHRVHSQNLRTKLKGKVDEYWKEWEYDAKDLLKTAPGPTDHPDAAVICLEDQTVTKIRRDGSSSEVVHETWKILDDDGKESMGKRPQSGDLMNVRVFTDKGECLEPIRAGRTFEMPGLAIGTVIEHEYKAERGPSEFQFTMGPWYLRDPELAQPYVHSRWVVIAPKDFQFEIIEKNLEAAHCKKTVIERGDEIVRIWETFNQDRIEPEPHMPPHDEFLPYVKFYQRRSLEELSGQYVDQSLGSTYVTPSIQAKADEVCAKLEGDTAKVKAIYNFVHETCVRPGGGSTAAQILAAKGGSKITLMMALLDAAKVPFNYALAASSPDVDESTDWDHPEPFQFHTGLLRVTPRDGEVMWVYPDGARYTPIELLPSSHWGAPVFICEGASGWLSVLPRGGRAELGATTKLDIELQPEGAAKATFAQKFLQMEAYGAKEQVKNMPKSNIDNFASRVANQLFTGAKMKKWETSKLDDPVLPFSITLHIEADSVVTEQNDGALTMKTGLNELHLKQQFAGVAARKFDLVMRGWTAVTDEASVDLGPYACSRLPGDLQMETKYGQYSLIFVREGKKLRIRRTLTLFPMRVTPTEYKDFLNFVDKIDAAERRPIVLEGKAGSAAPRKPKPDKEKRKPVKDDDDDDDK